MRCYLALHPFCYGQVHTPSSSFSFLGSSILLSGLWILTYILNNCHYGSGSLDPRHRSTSSAHSLHHGLHFHRCRRLQSSSWRLVSLLRLGFSLHRHYQGCPILAVAWAPAITLKVPPWHLSPSSPPWIVFVVLLPVIHPSPELFFSRPLALCHPSAISSSSSLYGARSHIPGGGFLLVWTLCFITLISSDLCVFPLSGLIYVDVVEATCVLD